MRWWQIEGGIFVEYSCTGIEHVKILRTVLYDAERKRNILTVVKYSPELKGIQKSQGYSLLCGEIILHFAVQQ